MIYIRSYITRSGVSKAEYENICDGKLCGTT